MSQATAMLGRLTLQEVPVASCLKPALGPSDRACRSSSLKEGSSLLSSDHLEGNACLPTPPRMTAYGCQTQACHAQDLQYMRSFKQVIKDVSLCPALLTISPKVAEGLDFLASVELNVLILLR